MAAQENPRTLYFRLLGAPRVFLGSEELAAFRTAKNQALLFFLAVMGSTQRRATLADLLWQDVGEDQANTSLRGTLYNLRQLLPEHLDVTRHTVTLHQPSTQSDVAQFDRLLKRTGEPEVDITQLQAAVSLYAGDFLEGFHVANAPQFELWAALERARLRDAVLNALLTLISWHMDARDFASALEHVNRLLSLDPANEAGHRQKMDVLVRMGRRDAAISQYETCKRMLWEHLEVLPAPETAALYELIVAGNRSQAGSARTVTGTPEPRGGAAQAAAPEARTRTGAGHDLSAPPPQVDFGEMPRHLAFFGRGDDLLQLTRWLTVDRCRLLAVAGMGGVGKTSLAAEAFAALARSLSVAPEVGSPAVGSGPGPRSAAAAPFDLMIWRSLVNAPPLPELLANWLEVITGHPQESMPGSLDDQLALLFRELDRRRCLLVLDNFESVLASGVRTGEYRPGYDAYRQLVERMAKTHHKSSLLLTTRELPRGVRRLEEDAPAVGILPLVGLLDDSGAELLKARGVAASADALAALVRHYSGNPLALKLVADTVRDLFGGSVQAFLSDDVLVFDDIRDVLDQQFDRLNDVEREVIVWLAVEREPAPVQEILDSLVRPPKRSAFLETVRSLRRGSLVEEAFDTGSGRSMRLGLPNVVMDYVTDRLVETLADEIASLQPDWLHRYPLLTAQSKEYLQESQRRLLVQPLAVTLVDRWGQPRTVQRLKELVDYLRNQAAHAPGYGGANCLHLLLHLQADLMGGDFSELAIWQADLRKGPLIDVDFRRSDLKGCAFADTFGLLRTVAISPNGRSLAAGGSDARVFTWQMPGYQPQHVLQGHSQAIGAVAYSPDGAVLASGGYDGQVCLWDAETGQLLDTLRKHTETVVAVAFSPDSAWLASAGADRQIVVWDLKRRQVYTCLAQAAWVNGLAWSPDGRLVACATDDRKVTLWDWRAGTLARTLLGHEGKAHAVAFSPDGAMLASGGEDSRICLWTLADPDRCRVLAGHTGWILSLAFSPDGITLASASTDGRVRLWDVPDGLIRRLLLGHTGWATAVAFSPNGDNLASAGYDQTVRLWNCQTGQVMHTLGGHLHRVDFIRFSTDGALLASSSLGGAVHLWEVDSGRLLNTLSGHKGAIRALAISPDNRLLAGGCDDYQVYLWEVAGGRLRQVLAGHQDAVRSASFTADGQYLVTGSHDRTVRIWEVATGRVHRVVPDVSIGFQMAPAIAPDGRHLAYGTTGHIVRLLDLPTGDRLTDLSVASETPVAIAFDRRGKLLACGTDAGTLWVWDGARIQAGRQEALRLMVRVSAAPVWAVMFGSDGRHVVGCTADEMVHVVDVGAGKVCYTTPGGPGAFSMAILDESRALMTSNADYELLVYDLGSGDIRRKLRGHSTQVTSIDASPAGNLVASSSADGTIRLWDAETGACGAVLEPPLPYARMNIAGARGISPAQRATLMALGAVDIS